MRARRLARRRPPPAATPLALGGRPAYRRAAAVGSSPPRPAHAVDIEVRAGQATRWEAWSVSSIVAHNNHNKLSGVFTWRDERSPGLARRAADVRMRAELLSMHTQTRISSRISSRGASTPIVFSCLCLRNQRSGAMVRPPAITNWHSRESHSSALFDCLVVTRGSRFALRLASSSLVSQQQQAASRLFARSRSRCDEWRWEKNNGAKWSQSRK